MGRGRGTIGCRSQVLRKVAESRLSAAWLPGGYPRDGGYRGSAANPLKNLVPQTGIEPVTF
jgi:hypothetical protein